MMTIVIKEIHNSNCTTYHACVHTNKLPLLLHIVMQHRDLHVDLLATTVLQYLCEHKQRSKHGYQ